jgi:hypothetical protein
MAHYALLDENNIVVNVITGRDENDVVDDIVDWEQHYSEVTGFNCKRTSYNTYANEHKENKTPFRKNYAMIGGSYDEENDDFIPPKIFPSWTLNEETFLWEPPYKAPKD